MAPDYPASDDGMARSIARRVTRLAGAAVLVVVALGAAHGVLPGGALILLAVAGVVAIGATGAWVARVTADEIRARQGELQSLASRLAGAEESAAAERARALNAMADRVERESGILMAKLAQQARSGLDADDLLRLAREGVVRAVRSASGDVDRRRWPHLRLAGTAEIQHAGGRVNAPIVDVSAGGMRIGAALAAGIGEHCRVRLPGVGPELPAKVLAVAAGETRLRFEIDDITRAVVSRMLESAARETSQAA